MSTEITIKEAAISLGISEQRIRTLCREKKLISRRVGNSWLIDKASLSNFGLVKPPIMW